MIHNAKQLDREAGLLCFGTLCEMSIPIVKVGYVSTNRFIVEQLRPFLCVDMIIVISHHFFFRILTVFCFFAIHIIWQLPP